MVQRVRIEVPWRRGSLLQLLAQRLKRVYHVVFVLVGRRETKAVGEGTRHGLDDVGAVVLILLLLSLLQLVQRVVRQGDALLKLKV